MKLNEIYNMDCVEGMKLLETNSIDVVLTSPPYNIIRPNSTDRGYDMYKDGMSNEDYIQWTLSIFNEFDRVVKENGVVLYNMSYGTENTECMSLTIAEILKQTNFTLADIIVWKKQSATPNNVSSNKLTRIVEFIYVFCRKDEFDTFKGFKKVVNERDTGQKIYENVFNFVIAKNNDGPTDLNKATFSTELCYKLLDIYATKDMVVLDPFMGTGTTAVSCLMKGCDYIGFELSEQQVEYANKRLRSDFGHVVKSKTENDEKNLFEFFE